jgi:hypothetical protein
VATLGQPFRDHLVNFAVSISSLGNLFAVRKSLQTTAAPHPSLHATLRTNVNPEVALKAVHDIKWRRAHGCRT